MRRRDCSVSLDIVIPCYNEEEMIVILLETLEEVFCPETLRRCDIHTVRYVIVDDGSTDRTPYLVNQYIERNLPIMLIRLSRNFGHQNAVSAGLSHADADLVAVIDSDLQDPPQLILDMVSKWREEFDVVYGQRRKRKGNALKRLFYWLFYRLVATLAEIRIPLDSGDFCLMDKKVVRAICDLPENQRFIRGLRAWVGFRQTGVSYERAERMAGKPKYTFRKLYDLATNGIASTSTRPLRIAQFCSVIFLIILGILCMLFFIQLTTQKESLISSEGLIIAILIASGNFVLLLCNYIMGAYIGRGYLETKNRPAYVVFEIVKKRSERPAADRAREGRIEEA